MKMSSLSKRNTKDSISEMLEVGNTVRVQVTFEEAILVKKSTPDKVKSLEIKIPAHDEPSESVKPKKSKTSGIEFDLLGHNVTFDILFDKTDPVEFELEIRHKNKGLISIGKFDLRMTDLLSRKGETRREITPTYNKLLKIKLKYKVSRSNSMREKSQGPSRHQESVRTLQPRSDRSESSGQVVKWSSGHNDKPESAIEMSVLNPPKSSTDPPKPSTNPPKTNTDTLKTSIDAPTTSIDTPKTNTNTPKTKTDALNTSTGTPKTRRDAPKTPVIVTEKTRPSFRPDSCIMVNTTFLHFAFGLVISDTGI